MKNWIVLSFLILLGVSPTEGQSTLLHQASASNTEGHVTTINNAATNGQANKLLFITKRYNGKYEGHQAGVWYNNGKWTIYNEDRQALSPTTFNVLAVDPSNKAFQHKAGKGNTSGHVTTINHPACNGNPNAVLLVTQNWKGAYNAKAIGVWYNGSHWTIYNQDKTAMPDGANFNILVLNQGANSGISGGKATVFTADSGVKQNQFGSHLANTPFQGTNALLFVTQNFSSGGPYNTHVPAIWHDGTRWTIYNDNKKGLPDNAHFNILSIGAVERPIVLNEPGFRVMINGIHCLQTGDAGNATDEPYIEVYVDNSSKPIKWGSRRMNESDRSWWEEFTDAVEEIFSTAQQEFWLMPGSVYAKEKVRIVLWEEDDGRGDSPFINNDDKIGEFTIYKSTPDNNFIEKDFNGDDGHYKVVCTKFTRGSLDASVEGNSRQIPVRVPILDQGREGACVAFSTVGALTTAYLNKTKPGSSREDLFDPIALYKRRQNTGIEGWWIDQCLNTILQGGIPFKNSSKRLYLKDYYAYYKDGRVVKYFLSSNGTLMSQTIERGGNGHNKMRAVLKSGEPLIVDYKTYPDFMAYAHVQGVYGGNISNQQGDLGHAVFVVGYQNPKIGTNEFPTWILQNSWGPAFGNNGLCTFAEGACDFDDIMYRIGDFEVR